jgi:hypothetical protein
MAASRVAAYPWVGVLRALFGVGRSTETTRPGGTMFRANRPEYPLTDPAQFDILVFGPDPSWGIECHSIN